MADFAAVDFAAVDFEVADFAAVDFEVAGFAAADRVAAGLAAVDRAARGWAVVVPAWFSARRRLRGLRRLYLGSGLRARRRAWVIGAR